MDLTQAMARVAKLCSQNLVSSALATNILLPLVTHYIYECDSKSSADQPTIEEAIRTIGMIWFDIKIRDFTVEML